MANENRLTWKRSLDGCEDVGLCEGVTIDEAICKLADLEERNTVEVVHGRWEQVQRWATKAKYRCSVCGREIMSATKVNIEKYPYCHCGAKMDGEEKDRNLLFADMEEIIDGC